MWARRWSATAVPLLVVACVSCAHAPGNGRSVPIDSRPTPPQPVTVPGNEPGASDVPPPAPQPSREPPKTAEARLAADTLAAASAIRRCAGRSLLAEQESTVEAASRLLAEVREAIAAGDMPRAEARARVARQLTRSLVCQ